MKVSCVKYLATMYLELYILESSHKPLVPFPPLLDKVHNAIVVIEIIGP